MRRPFVRGVLATLLAEAVVAALVIASGVIDVSATKKDVPDRILAYASTRSIAHHARDEKNPLAGDPGALKTGRRLYEAMCAECHGAPGRDAEEFAAGLHPAPPDLASPQVQSFTDGMLYEAIARGIGSTGMPAFGATHAPDQIWSIVAFVRHLPALTPEEKKERGREEAREDHAATAAGGAGHRVHQVSISGFKFDPPTLEVKVGDVVAWKNADFTAHTATAEGGSFDTNRIDVGETKRVTIEKKGRFPYFCRYHLAMKGTLIAR